MSTFLDWYRPYYPDRKTIGDLRFTAKSWYFSSAKKEEAAALTDAPNGAPVCAAASFALIG